jgi:hypothetical protein
MVAGVALVALPRCELLVNLDRGEVDGALPDGCPICTDLTEGGEGAGEDAIATDGGASDGSKDGAPLEDGPSDGGAEGATMDSGVGE